MRPSRGDEVEHYVRTGRHEDDFYLAWPGKGFFARAETGRAALREALVTEVRKRTPQATVPDGLADLDVVAFTRAKIGPMVRGLFPRAEQQTVLDSEIRHRFVPLAEKIAAQGTATDATPSPEGRRAEGARPRAAMTGVR